MENSSYNLPYSITEDGNQIIDADGTVIIDGRSNFPYYIALIIDGWKYDAYAHIKAGGTLDADDVYNVHCKLDQMPL